MRGWGALLAAIVVSAAARTVSAADVEAVHVEVVAPAECTDDRRFFDEVRARTARVRLAAPADEDARTIAVRIVQNGASVDGEIVVRDPRAAPARRSVTGETCDAVASVLALVAALAIDPMASTAPVRKQAPAPPRAPPPTTPARSLSPLDRPPAAPAPSRWRVSAGVHAGSFGARPTDPLFCASAFADMAVQGPPLLAPSFRLSVHRTLDASIEAGAGTATLRWTFGRAEACPIRFVLGPWIRARPCALFEAGVIEAGGAIARAQFRMRPWAAGGAQVRFAWTVASAMALEADVGLAFPVVRETFFFEPSPDVYRAAPALGVASLGVAVLFP
jgi:hypothetical protein